MSGGEDGGPRDDALPLDEDLAILRYTLSELFAALLATDSAALEATGLASALAEYMACISEEEEAPLLDRCFRDSFRPLCSNSVAPGPHSVSLEEEALTATTSELDSRRREDWEEERCGRDGVR